MAAWRGLERGDDVRELRPWLYRIARNTSLNQLRDVGLRPRRADGVADRGGRPRGGGPAPRRRAADAHRPSPRCPERQREALLRTAINGQAQEEVARDLGLSSTAMRQLVHRARVSVRAAATAVVPMPAATWLAAGAGGAGTAATLAKAGTLVVLAGGAVTAPALIEHGPPTPRHRSEAHAAAKPKPRDEAAPRPDRDGRRAAHRRDHAGARGRRSVGAADAASRRSDDSGRARAASDGADEQTDERLRARGPRPRRRPQRPRRRRRGRRSGPTTAAAAAAATAAATTTTSRPSAAGCRPAVPTPEADASPRPSRTAATASRSSGPGGGPATTRLGQGRLGRRRRLRRLTARHTPAFAVSTPVVLASRRTGGTVLRRNFALAVMLAVAASLTLAGGAFAKDRNHDRIPDKWEKRHHLSLHHKQGAP